MDNSFDKFLDKLSIYISCIAFAGMVLIVVLNVFTRGILSKSLLFAEELSYMFFIYSVFFGVCVLFKRMSLVSVNIVVAKMPKQAGRVVMVLTFLLLLVINIILFWFSWELASNSWNRITPRLGIPYFYNYLSPTISFLILTYYSFRFFIKQIKGEKIEEVPIGQES